MRAVAANVPSLAPFFDESKGLGKDVTDLQADRTPGGVQASNRPGLYGGTEEQPGGGSSDDGNGGSGGQDNGGSDGQGNGRGGGQDDGQGKGPAGVFGGSTKPGTCLVTKLKNFLTDPGNSAKAREWAKVLHIRRDEIGKYIDKLTPVVLRHDTLVKNHDFKDGKAVSYDSLLEAGIAILVDHQGLPAVKCSCGNPLRPFTHSADKISVKFEHGNKKWASYQPHNETIVQPPPGGARVDRLQLVDVQNPGTVIARDAGMDTEDETFRKDEPRTVPTVAQQSYADAANALAAAGLTPAYDGDQPADDAIVTGSNPPAGSEQAWGEPVTLFVTSGSATPTDTTTAEPPSPTTTPTTGYPTGPTTSPTTVGPTAPTTSPTTVDPTTPTTDPTTGGSSSTDGGNDGGTGGLPTDAVSTSASQSTSPDPTLSDSPTSSEVVSAAPDTSDTAPGEPTSGESSVSTA